MRYGTRAAPGHLLHCLVRLRELGYAEVWCRDEPDGRAILDELLVEVASVPHEVASSLYFVDGLEVRMLLGTSEEVVYRALKICPRGGLS